MDICVHVSVWTAIFSYELEFRLTGAVTLIDRWRALDVHDIVVNCAKLSLDLIEGGSEESKCPVIGTLKYPASSSQLDLRPQIAQKFERKDCFIKCT